MDHFKKRSLYTKKKNLFITFMLSWNHRMLPSGETLIRDQQKDHLWCFLKMQKPKLHPIPWTSWRQTLHKCLIMLTLFIRSREVVTFLRPWMSILKLYSISLEKVPKAEIIWLIIVLSKMPFNRIQVNEHLENSRAKSYWNTEGFFHHQGVWKQYSSIKWNRIHCAKNPLGHTWAPNCFT